MIVVKIRTNNIELILKRRMLTKTWLANKLKVSRSYMAQLIHNKRNPGAVLSKRLAMLLCNSSVRWDDIFEPYEKKKKTLA